MQPRSRHGRLTESRPGTGGQAPSRAKQRAFCIAALPEGEDLSELRELLRTAGVAVVGQTVQHREHPHPNSYLGPGKVTEVKALAKAADANVIACDDELTPRQERNLEAELDMPVVDRTSVILDIFAGHAHSAEGKLQVELAQLEYNMARMRGLWTHLDRLGVGGVGTRGPGETQIETDRRLARNRISALKRRLEEVQGSRETMRAERQRTGLPQIALAGYTNAGKSTLLNRLTGAEAGVQDRLFHTLDPTTRVMRVDGRPFLVTDTVGFIRKLPHQLVEAFTATLEETRLADLILHVVDASVEEDEMLAMMKAVEDVLEEIGAGDRPRRLVLNKADAIGAERRAELRRRHPDGILVSAVGGEGVDRLRERIEDDFVRRMQPVELLLPYAEGGRLAELHEIAGDLEREDTPEGVRVSARVTPTVAERFARFAVGAHAGNGGGRGA
ncbi:MAG TPA: GTPase HflX [Solirubrobacteraceae bacterium]|nr:GTPase HflX [Solirubrobacteraceae bacterium]